MPALPGTAQLIPALARVAVLCGVVGLAPGVMADDSPGADWTGRTLPALLDDLRSDGFPVAWSSNLVTTEQVITQAPAASTLETALAEVLTGFGLDLDTRPGLWLVVRPAPQSATAPAVARLDLVVRDEAARLLDATVHWRAEPQLPPPGDLGQGLLQFRPVTPGRYRLTIQADGYQEVQREVLVEPGQPQVLSVRLTPADARLEALEVTASRYLLFSDSQFFIDQRAIQSLPDIGEDPVRAVHRLPGTAAGGWSAKSHFRGGEENETAIFLNGLQLLDPFHVRDFHNVFSSIDARTIAGVEAFTGGYPTPYGDRMSGILLLRSQQPEAPRHHEIGVSVFNTSVLTSGFSDTGRLDWLVSARRSNLDLVLDPVEHGEPSYTDVFASLGINQNDGSRLTFNAQRADDRIRVVTEHKTEEQEFADSRTRNENYWLQWERSWAPGLDGQTVVSVSRFDNERDAVANDPEQLVARVLDHRSVDIFGLRQDFWFHGLNRHQLSFGAEVRRYDARYDYHSRAQYDGFYLAYPGVPETRVRNSQLAPGGTSLGLYIADRWSLASGTDLEIGLRWDHQDWSQAGGDSQVSPRLRLTHRFGDDVRAYFTWGRYHQSQGIHELQVEDGVEHFFPAQQATHAIAGFRSRLRDGLTLRVEAYEKTYDDLRPRFENLLDPLPLIPELEPDRIGLAPDSARARGVEVTVELDVNEEISGWASFAAARVTDRLGGREEARNWDQRHSVQGGLAWRRGAWEVGLATRWRSGWPTTAATLTGEDESDLALVFGPRNAERLGDFFNLDARVARTWTWPGKRLTAFIEVSNLSNRQNECCVDYDGEIDEDTGEAVLERSVDHWLGITPSAGLLFEF